MNSRFRHLAALFALIALTVGTVQGLWASSTCRMEMSVAMAAWAEAAPPSGACAQGVSALSDRAGSSQDEGGAGTAPCPLMPIGVTGSCGAVVALPAGSSTLLEPSSPEALLPRSASGARDLLLAAAFFRPPIA